MHDFIIINDFRIILTVAIQGGVVAVWCGAAAAKQQFDLRVIGYTYLKLRLVGCWFVGLLVTHYWLIS